MDEEKSGLQRHYLEMQEIGVAGGAWLFWKRQVDCNRSRSRERSSRGVGEEEVNMDTEERFLSRTVYMCIIFFKKKGWTETRSRGTYGVPGRTMT